MWSKIDPETEVGKQFAAKGYYIPGTQWIDFFNPEAAALYWKNFSERMLSLGIDAWWQGATERRMMIWSAGACLTVQVKRCAYDLSLTVNKTVYEAQKR